MWLQTSIRLITDKLKMWSAFNLFPIKHRLRSSAPTYNCTKRKLFKKRPTNTAICPIDIVTMQFVPCETKLDVCVSLLLTIVASTMKHTYLFSISIRHRQNACWLSQFWSADSLPFKSQSSTVSNWWMAFTYQKLFVGIQRKRYVLKIWLTQPQLVYNHPWPKSNHQLFCYQVSINFT